MQDKTEKRRLVLTAAAQTIATACRHLYQDDIQAAKASGDIIALSHIRTLLKRDYETWTAPIAAALEDLDKPQVIIPSIMAAGVED
jgi:hypothetical protein